MGDPLEEVAAIMDSQDPGGSFGSVARAQINIGELPVGATEVSQNAYDADNEKTGNSGISREPTACVTEPPPKKKVKRTGRPFSKMKVIGNRAWFLKPEHMKDFTDNLVNIVGIIKQCPRKSNDNFYGIDWTGNDGMGLPEGLHPEEFLHPRLLSRFIHHNVSCFRILVCPFHRHDILVVVHVVGSQLV